MQIEDNITGGAKLSDCGTYRYELSRNIQPGNVRQCLFIMLNPSTADASQDGPTIRRCMGYARSWGFGTLKVVNLFAYRSTSPEQLRLADDPVGPDNMDTIVGAADIACRAYSDAPGIVVCAWGNHGSFMEQGETVLGWLERESIPAHHLKMTGVGQPSHPLYLKKNLEPVLMTEA